MQYQFFHLTARGSSFYLVIAVPTMRDRHSEGAGHNMFLAVGVEQKTIQDW